MTVKELKEKLQNIPEDMRVEIYTGREPSYDIFWAEIVSCDDSECNKCGGDGSCVEPVFIISCD